MFSSEAWLSNSSDFYNSVATQSLRFDSGSSAYLNFAPTSSATSATTGTLSFWVKRATLSTNQYVFHAKDTSVSPQPTVGITFNTDDTLSVTQYDGTSPFNSSNYDFGLTTSAKFRDVGAWYHFILKIDTTNATEADRFKLYVNGVDTTLNATNPGSGSQDFPSQNQTTAFFQVGNQRWGATVDTNTFYDGYLAETNGIDGTALDPTSFGEFKNGVWIPIEYTGSYGTNGFRLQFNRTGTGTASSSTIGADTSGNTHHFTSSGIVASDCDMPDSPENNFATLNPLSFLTENLLQNGNLELPYQTTDHRANTGTMFMQTGKWYFEVYNTTSAASGTVAIGVGLQDISKLLSYASGDDNYVFYSNNNNAKFVSDTSEITLGTGGTHVPTAGSIIQVAYDADTGNIFIGVNNTYIAEDGGSDGNPATGANPTKTLSTNIDYIPFVGVYNNIAIANFGQDSTFAGATTAGGNTDANGIGDFKYSVPSGYLALCTANLPEPTISPNEDTQADDYFNTVLYTGNSSSNHSITGVGFQPDFVWLKSRNASYDHELADVVRGSGKTLQSNNPSEEFTSVNYMESFDSDGFTLGNWTGGNGSGTTFVAWNWKAGGTGVSNTNGSITSTVSANTDAGFSIVTYTGFSGSSGTATVGHSLSQAPEIIIHKSRTRTSAWWTQAPNVLASPSHFLALNESSAPYNLSSYGTMSAPTSSVFSINGVDGVGGESADYVAYCFHSVEGYSKFGSYTGNGSTDGTFVYTGFRPAFVLVKSTSSGRNWPMYDSVRDTKNAVQATVTANTSNAEFNSASYAPFDFVSNGLKLRLGGTSSTVSSDVNISGQTYIYMAFAENPFKYANAR